MRYWSTDFDVPFPGSDGAKVHTGMCSSSFVTFYRNSAMGALQHVQSDGMLTSRLWQLI